MSHGSSVAAGGALIVPTSCVTIHVARDPLRWPLGTDLVDGLNNKIKFIERVACGFCTTPAFRAG